MFVFYFYDNIYYGDSMNVYDGKVVFDSPFILFIVLAGVILGIIVLVRFLFSFFDKFNIDKKKVNVNKVNHFNDGILSEYEKNYNKSLSFRTKVDNIKRMIINDKIHDIKELANKNKASLEECIMIIKFLETKNFIPNYFINTRIFILAECSVDDEKLLLKYRAFLNGKTKNYSTGTGTNFSYLELLYLYKKGLAPEIEIDEENKQIIFLDLNKKHTKDLISVICNSCGALNDVNRGQKIKCKYCGSEIIGPKK